MQLRYNFRVYPSVGQRMALARAFGCARVVFNDGLRARQEAHRAQLPYIKDTDLQKQVITFFSSVTGKRKGAKVASPRFKSRKDNRQSIRLTANGFALRGNGKLYVVAVEDLAVKGLARTRLAKSVHDAGWSQFVTMLEYKAARYGRTLVKICRFEPTSQVCSACGIKDGPKPLNVREWTCGAFGTAFDRDVNAAVNVAKAAGLAVSACGAQVRPELVPAPRREAGTRPELPTQPVWEQMGIPVPLGPRGSQIHEIISRRGNTHQSRGHRRGALGRHTSGSRHQCR